MIAFYLVRHAHADLTPDENRPLSARGYKDAVRVADILKKYPINFIYSSPFLRAHQTIMPLAFRLSLPVNIELDLRERRLGNTSTEDFFDCVRETWRNPSFAYPEGESNATAQERGIGIVNRLQKELSAGHIVLSTHGNLMALILQWFDPTIDFVFWKLLTMPDIYELCLGHEGEVSIRRLWCKNAE